MSSLLHQYGKKIEDDLHHQLEVSFTVQIFEGFESKFHLLHLRLAKISASDSIAETKQAKRRAIFKASIMINNNKHIMKEIISYSDGIKVCTLSLIIDMLNVGAGDKNRFSCTIYHFLVHTSNTP